MKSFFVVLSIIAWPVFLSNALAESQPDVKSVQVGDILEGLTLEDPQGNQRFLDSSTRVVVISSTNEHSKAINQWLAKRNPSFLKDHRTEYISDITPMPAIISKLFARPKMRKYKFPMLLVNDQSFASKYPSKSGKIAIFEIDAQRRISAISFFDDFDGIVKEKLSYYSVSGDSANKPEGTGSMSSNQTQS
jgi:hypothetical protein